MYKSISIIVVSAWIALSCSAPKDKNIDNSSEDSIDKDLTQYVDPFIGTGFHGHTFPGATVPFGMVQLSPDTHLDGWDASSGYHYDDTQIYGFSHTHLSGTGIGDLGDILIVPFSGNWEPDRAYSFNKSDEKATAGYYSVILNESSIKAELTADTRTGFHRYTFPSGGDRNIAINLGHILQKDWGHKAIKGEIKIVDSRTVVGLQQTQGWAKKQRVAFVVKFSEPFESTAFTKESIGGVDVAATIHFSKSDNPIEFTVTLSPVDISGAYSNREADFQGDFDAAVAHAKERWNRALGKIAVNSSIPEYKTIFYTALYHSMMAPTIFQDADGRYIRMDREESTMPKGSTNYTVFSMWDTFRALHPLLTIIEPKLASEFTGALIQKYREGGLLPKWELYGNYTGTMVGYPAVSIIADAMAKDLYSGDVTEAIQAAVTSSTYNPEAFKFKPHPSIPSRVMPKHIYFKETLGWVPCDSLSASVSYGLEMSYYDWCVAQIANLGGDEEIYKGYLERSKFYRHYFDSSTKLMRGKNYDGSWKTPFSPRYSSHMKSDYTEGNAWQYSFLVPHDPADLASLMGGEHNLESQLDTLFTTSSEIEGEEASGDITGLIGQYAHGNEPSHHMAYLYNWTNSPYKTQQRVDQILKEFYTTAPDGIIGNEDCGQMSAWYVLSSLGFYQVCPGDPTYSIGRPLIDSAKVKTECGVLNITAKNNSSENRYVQSVKLNGEELSDLTFTHKEIKYGGKLEFVMGNKPKERD